MDITYCKKTAHDFKLHIFSVVLCEPPVALCVTINKNYHRDTRSKHRDTQRFKSKQIPPLLWF